VAEPIVERHPDVAGRREAKGRHVPDSSVIVAIPT
jgi:hypothetical protein